MLINILNRIASNISLESDMLVITLALIAAKNRIQYFIITNS